MFSIEIKVPGRLQVTPALLVSEEIYYNNLLLYKLNRFIKFCIFNYNEINT
jgi:hypothetical protein